MSNPTPFDHILEPTYSVHLADGRIVRKRPDQMTKAELDAFIDSEYAAASADLRHADALQAFADEQRGKVIVGPGDV